MRKKIKLIIIFALFITAGYYTYIFALDYFSEDVTKHYSSVDNVKSSIYMIGLEADHEFEIELKAESNVINLKGYLTQHKAVEVFDSEGELLELNIERDNERITIKPPLGNYEAGEIYTIKIDDQFRFIDQELEGKNEIVFSIFKEEVNTYTLVDDDIKEVELIDNENGTYKLQNGTVEVGEIIVIEENGLSAAKKVTKVKENGDDLDLTIEDALYEEVFEDLDIYGEIEVDFGDFQLDDEALANHVRESNFLSFLISTVEAQSNTKGLKPQIEVTSKLKKDSISLEVKLLFEELTFSKKSDEKVDLVIILDNTTEIHPFINIKGIKIREFSLNSITKSSLKISIEKNSKDKEPKDITKQYNSIASALNEALSESELDLYLPIGKLPIFSNGISTLMLETGFYFDTELSGEFKSNAYNSFGINCGMVRKSGKLVPFNYTDSMSDLEDINFVASVRAETGFETKLYLSAALKTIEVGLDAKIGLYAQLEGVIGSINEIKSGYDITKEWGYKIEAGVLLKSNGFAKVNAILKKFKVEIPIIDEEFPILEYGNYKLCTILPIETLTIEGKFLVFEEFDVTCIDKINGDVTEETIQVDKEVDVSGEGFKRMGNKFTYSGDQEEYASLTLNYQGDSEVINVKLPKKATIGDKIGEVVTDGIVDLLKDSFPSFVLESSWSEVNSNGQLSSLRLSIVITKDSGSINFEYTDSNSVWGFKFDGVEIVDYNYFRFHIYERVNDDDSTTDKDFVIEIQVVDFDTIIVNGTVYKKGN